jgi:hypothetical protein
MKRKMRIALIVGAVALASGAAADPKKPQQPSPPLTPEIVAQRTECGKLGAAWLKQHPLVEKNSYRTSSFRAFYGSKTNQCWLIKVELWGGSWRERHLIDAQTGAETMTCIDRPAASKNDAGPKRDCDYIEKVEDATLASGFMTVPPSADPLGLFNGSPKQ